MRNSTRILALAAAAALLFAGCGSADTETPADGAPRVVVSYYAVEFLAAQIGGEHITLTNVVPAGADSHEIELTMQDASLFATADVALTLGGFQPAVDAAAAESDSVTDLAPKLDLTTRDGVIDPHFWLDPERMIVAAEAIADTLSAADPAHADDYRAGVEQVTAALTDIDDAYTSAFESCAFDSFVTGHAAFGYLADAYGLTEIAIAGIDPETEPSPAALAAVRAEITKLGLPMIFAEPNQTKVASVLAEDLGIGWGILDPIETVTGGHTYLSVMNDNLSALKEGLQCR